MSFLDSILNEISGAKAPSEAPRAPTPRARDSRPTIKKGPVVKSESTGSTASASVVDKVVTNGDGSGSSFAKRKASGDVGNERQKVLKRDNTGAERSGRSSASATPPASTQRYKGTAGLDRSKVVARPAKPPQATVLPSTTEPVTAKAASKHTVSSPVSTSAAAQSAPKKGSYAEMLARAKAAANKTYTGIKHKPTEKVKPVKQGQEEKVKAVDRDTERKRRLGSTEAHSGAESDKNAEKKRQRSELAYKGTMRAAPSALAYKGTMHMKKADADHDHLNGRRRSQGADRNRKPDRRYEDGDEDDEDEQEAYDDESDLSDMEANVWEVDEEESHAARIAREEDKREQELEARLQRDKQAKKRAMLKKLEAEAIARSDRRRHLG